MANKSLTHTQFLQMWYNRMGINNKNIQNHMEDIYIGLLDTIREEVRLNGELKIKNLGKFYLIETGGYEKNFIGGVASSLGAEGKHFVPVHYLPKFTASQNFKDYTNDALVSKEGRRKKKSGKLTNTDKELEARNAEKQKTDIRRILERKKSTGESIGDISKDTRQTLKR